MYEFFFSNTLLKAMKIPFIEDTYMISFFERVVRKRDTLENKRYHPSYDCRRVNEDRRRDRTMMLKKFYEFFSLLYDSKVCTPFSQFLDSKFLKKFKNTIKEELNNPQETKRKSKSKDYRQLGLQLKDSGLGKSTKQDNLLIKDPNLKETSRFGKTTPVDIIQNEYTDDAYTQPKITPNIKKKVSELQKLEQKVDNDMTLSLSFTGKKDESGYMIYDPSYGRNYGPGAQNRSKGTRKRILNYRSDAGSDYDPSNRDTFSRNSRGSYKIEYLMQKAFTPIVPSDHQLNDISRITWNRKDLFDNISYSRNNGLGQKVSNHTDKQGRGNQRNLTKEIPNLNQSFGSPRNQRNNRMASYHRSLSNGRRTLSSIGGTNPGNFPPIGFGSKQLSDTLEKTNESKSILNTSRRRQQQSRRSVLSPKVRMGTQSKPKESDKMIKGSSQGSKSRQAKNVILKPHINGNKATIEARHLLNMTNSSGEHQPLIKYTPVGIQQETPRLPCQLQFKSNSRRSSRKQENKKEDEEISLDRSDLNSSVDSNMNLKGYLESNIPHKKRTPGSKATHYAIETVGQIEGQSSRNSDEEHKSLVSNISSAMSNKRRRIKNRSQKFDYNMISPNYNAESGQNDTYILNPSTRLHPETQNQHYENTNSSDTTEKNFKQLREQKKCYTKTSYLKKNISFDECTVSPIPQINL